VHVLIDKGPKLEKKKIKEQSVTTK